MNVVLVLMYRNNGRQGNCRGLGGWESLPTEVERPTDASSGTYGRLDEHLHLLPR